VNAVSTIQPLGEVKDKFKMNLDGDVLTVVSEQWARRHGGRGSRRFPWPSFGSAKAGALKLIEEKRSRHAFVGHGFMS